MFMGDCIVDGGSIPGLGSGWKLRQPWIKNGPGDLRALPGNGEILNEDAFFIMCGGGSMLP